MFHPATSALVIKQPSVALRLLFPLVLSLAFAIPALAATVVISNERSGDLVFMDATGETTDVIKLCNRPRGMAQHKSTKSLYVACSDDGNVIEFNLDNKQPARLFAELPGAMSVAIHEPSNRLFVTNEGAAQATVLDIASGNVLATLPTGHEPDGVALTEDGSLIFIASENAGIVHVYDGINYQPRQEIITNLRPRRLTIRNQELWVSSEMGSRVEIFNTENLQKIDEIVFAPRGFRSEQLTPVDILFDASGDTAFVALGSANHVVIIDAVKREILKYILVGRRPWGLGLTPDGKRLFVLNGLSDDVTIINLDTRRPVKTSRTGLVPHSVEIID